MSLKSANSYIFSHNPTLRKPNLPIPIFPSRFEFLSSPFAKSSFLPALKTLEMGFGNGCTQTSTASQVKCKRDAPSDQDVHYEERLRRMILESAWRECYERYEGRMKAMDDQLAILRSEVEFVRSKVARTESQKMGIDSTPCADNGRVRKMRLGPMPPQVRSKRDAPSELYEERFQRRMKAFDDQLAFLRSEVEHLRSQGLFKSN